MTREGTKITLVLCYTNQKNIIHCRGNENETTDEGLASQPLPISLLMVWEEMQMPPYAPSSHLIASINLVQ